MIHVPAVRRAPALASLVLAAVFSAWSSLSWAEPDQMPLTTRSAPPPAPNVMMTIDDSGSMLSDAMPEGTFTVNGKSVGLVTHFWPGAFPADPRKGGNGGSYQYCTVTAIKGGEGVYQAQFRSPQINSIWYNPDIRYRPWVSTDGVNRMADSSATNASWDPIIGTAKTNLVNTRASAVPTRWCTSSSTTDTVSRQFYPGLYYILRTGGDPTLVASYDRYDIAVNGEHAPAVKNAARTDCAGARCTMAEERTNFANWYTYYRMRESLTKAAVSETFANFKGKIRAGWGQINPGNGNMNTTSVVQQGINTLDAAYLTSLLTNVQKIESWPGTPLRTAIDSTSGVGPYFQKTDADNPWLTTVGTANSGLLSCRRSVNVLMTDGYYNDSYSGSNVDNTLGTDYSSAVNNPNGYSPTRYSPAAPYSDNYSSTLADAAMKYYVTDLQAGAENKVPPVDGDIAYWQHLTQFTVGLGVKGTLDSSSAAAKLATIKAIKAGTLSWPDPSGSQAAKIDDLWHAAVNTGGDFYSVRNVTELADALGDAFGRAAGSENKEAGVAVSSGSVVSGSLKIVPKYRSGSWVGDVDAYKLDAQGNAPATPTWSASNGLPAWASRNLFTWNGSSAVPFTWSGMGSAANTLVGSEAIANYIRGDTSQEGVGNPYRNRSGKLLGDFINSPPVYVKDQVSLGYSALDSSYTAYLTAKATRSNGVVFVGSNDGMMHAFDGATGAELMGYLPRAGLSKLNLLTNKDYGTPSNYHRFFVDGPSIETDAYITTRRSATASWSNVVVSTMGAGGTGIFAMHVPTASPTSLDADTILWERSAADDTDFGYMIGEPAVGKIQGGTLSSGWKVFVGNGVDSASGRAVLMVIDLASGAVNKIQLDSGSGNGATGVALVKDSKGQVVAAYVGDLKGQLWRVDFGDAANTSSWQVGFNNKPLFQAKSSAGDQQPITTAPLVMARSDSAVGRLVVFGTGKLTTEVDADSTKVQTVYGVLDPVADGSTSVGVTGPFEAVSDDRDLLVVRTVSATPVLAADGRYYFAMTGAAIDWNTKRGWYMDLPISGQRVLYPAQNPIGDYVLVQTMVPAAAAAECSVSYGSGVNYLLMANTGMPSTDPTYDTNNDGKIDSKDLDTNGDGTVDANDARYGGYKTNADGRDEVIVTDSSGGGAGDPNKTCQAGFVLTWVGDTGATGQWLCLKKPAGGVGGSKVIIDRVWRQIVNPPMPAS